MGKIIIEPYLLALQENSVVIAWEVNQNSNYSLKYKKIGAKTLISPFSFKASRFGVFGK